MGELFLGEQSRVVISLHGNVFVPESVHCWAEGPTCIGRGVLLESGGTSGAVNDCLH